MAANLTESNRLLEEGKSALEVRVQERTQDLEIANHQLVSAQEQLVKSTTLAAIGELTAGIAHDLRNPLGAIKNAAYMLRKGMVSNGVIEADPRFDKYIEIINKQVGRSSDSITELMNFTRLEETNLVETDLGEVLDLALETMIKNDNITILRNIDENVKPVMADGEQLQRVMLNLANNAQDAMPDGGQLAITAKNVNNHVEIIFTDTGEGISEENLGKIFDPLFTTKIKGTGLGLAVCQGIIERHGGTIHARRNVEPSGGVTFEVRIPATELT